MDIVTIYPDPNTHGRAIGRLIVQEVRPGITIDYEEFELLFITVRVYDDNTELGTGYDECKFYLSLVSIKNLYAHLKYISPPYFLFYNTKMKRKLIYIFTASFTITIIDMNDNKPIFAIGTLEQNFRARELSDSGMVIGSVLATDNDGPLYNQVLYTIL